jgi:acetyl esterase/lipase
MGHPRDEDARAERLATACGLAVVSPHYRLAPQRPYPAGPDDAEAAAAWLLANAAREFGTDRLIIGGTSAGAHLAALTLLRLRDRNGRTGFAAADLAYGIYDLGLTPSARNWGERKLILNTPRLEWAVRQFLPTGDPRRPEISPLYAGLAGLPPALFTVGTLDPVLDDTLFLWSRWCAAGNRGELAVYPGGCHAFDHLPGPLAPQAHARTAAFLRQALEAP